MKGLTVVLVGAACGFAWWVISVALGAKAYGALGTHAAIGVVSGACTGVVVASLSVPVYRRLSLPNLLWYSPFTVYIAVAIYGLILFLIRSLTNDFHAGQNGGAVGVESVIGMWWGITVIAPIGVAVQLLAYANHRLLRAIFASGSATPPAGTPSPLRRGPSDRD